MKKESFLQFLKYTPGNLVSILIIWALCISGMLMAYNTREDFNQFNYLLIYTFMALIMFLSVLRVYLIWKRL